MSQTTSVLALTLVLGIAVAPVAAHLASAQQAPDPRVADLVRAGKVRVGLGVVAPHWAVKDPVTGELRGLAIDLARALAERLGLELVPIAYPSPPSILEGLKSDAWDVGFSASHAEASGIASG